MKEEIAPIWRADKVNMDCEYLRWKRYGREDWPGCVRSQALEYHRKTHDFVFCEECDFGEMVKKRFVLGKTDPVEREIQSQIPKKVVKG